MVAWPVEARQLLPLTDCRTTPPGEELWDAICPETPFIKSPVPGDTILPSRLANKADILNEAEEMATAPLAVTKLVTKSHASPDEVRTPSKTRVEIVRLPGFTLGRFNLDPGWKWSERIKPVVKTDLCQVPHIGYVISGRLTVRLKDGTEKAIAAGESYAIPPGHDAWVEGSERFVAIEALSAEQYAKP